MRHLLAAAMLLAAGTPVFSQKYDPPPAKTPDAATLKKIDAGLAELRSAVAAAVKELPEIHRADLEVYVKAVEWITRHNEWYTADSGKQTLAVIEQGIKRAESVQGKWPTLRPPWLEPKGRSVARGYRSAIDDSVQPYGVVYPPGFGADRKKKWRLDIYLHGRDSTLTEVKFLNQHNGKEAPKDQDFVQIDIYGRGNNAYRWAGERDVLDAVGDFLRTDGRDLIDRRRLVLKGFSMGGAGTWHLGLRHSDAFAVLQPGAGFTTTHGYVAKLPEKLPDYQEKCLTIYDAYRYAENAFDVPIVAYSGEIDKQRQAAEIIQAELKTLGLSDRMTHLIGPGLEHKFPPEWQKAVETELRKHAGGGKGRAEFPDRVRLVAYTSADARCDWVVIDALDHQYERARVDAKWDGKSFAVTTENVRNLTLFGPPGTSGQFAVTIDGQAVKTEWVVRLKKPEGHFHKGDGRWEGKREQFDNVPPVKEGESTGPIDQAFVQPFLCVIGTGNSPNAAMDAAARAQLERFQREWDKYMRGMVRVKKDSEVTDLDRLLFNLILFGDPSSNSEIARDLKDLPLRWTGEQIEFGGNKYDARTHLPILNYPLSRNHRVVLNSGHTFHAADFQGTNALLYPRLGDYAIVKPTPTARDPAAFEVVTAGLFDEQWQVPKK